MKGYYSHVKQRLIDESDGLTSTINWTFTQRSKSLHITKYLRIGDLISTKISSTNIHQRNSNLWKKVLINI